MYPIHNCIDDEAISLLDLGIPRDAMTFGAPKTEALDEDIAQKMIYYRIELSIPAYAT
jgi:hypothetical protein